MMKDKISMVFPDTYPDETITEIINKTKAAWERWREAKGGDDPFVICPRCHKEVLSGDLTQRGCLKCEPVSQAGRNAIDNIMGQLGQIQARGGE